MPQAPAQSFPRPLVTVDLAIFSIQGDALRVLLVERPSGAGEPFPGLWALPGGFVDVDVDADLDAAPAPAAPPGQPAPPPRHSPPSAPKT